MDAAGDAGLSPDQARALQGEHHLVDGRRGDAEVTLQVGFGRGPAEHQGVGVDEGEVLPLLVGEAGSEGGRQTPGI